MADRQTGRFEHRRQTVIKNMQMMYVGVYVYVCLQTQVSTHTYGTKLKVLKLLAFERLW